jgi:hypothetical protein
LEKILKVISNIDPNTENWLLFLNFMLDQ